MPKEIEYPIEIKTCASNDHYFNLMVDGKCDTCNKRWGLHQEKLEEIKKEVEKPYHREELKTNFNLSDIL